MVLWKIRLKRASFSEQQSHQGGVRQVAGSPNSTGLHIMDVVNSSLRRSLGARSIRLSTICKPVQFESENRHDIHNMQ